MNTRADRFPLFDSLRAIAALMIVCTHIATFGGVVDDGDWIQPYVGQLVVGVPVFLLISGFLLYRPFALASLTGARRPSFMSYGWRRFLRIVPPYWVALVLITVWLGSNHVYPAGNPAPTVFSGEGFLAYFAFGQVYDTEYGGGGIPQAWTIDLEVAFYIVLPLLALLRPRLAVLAGVIAASVLYKIVVLTAEDMDGIPTGPLPLLSSLPAYMDHFALGMGLALVSARVQASKSEPGFVRVIDRHPWLPWLVAAVAFVAVSRLIGMDGTPSERMSEAQYLARHALFAVVALGLLLPAVFGDATRGLVRRVLANRALLYVGLVSYGVYLWHLAIIVQLVRWDLEPAEIVAPAVLGAVAAGSLSYYLVERPVLSLKRLIPDRRDDQPGAVSAPSAPPAV
jgi:peptidoglycan/LPS O-acetylase OafA/YrhL